MFRYTATLKHWSYHVLTNAAFVYMILFNSFLPLYNLLMLFVQFQCLVLLNKLIIPVQCAPAVVLPKSSPKSKLIYI